MESKSGEDKNDIDGNDYYDWVMIPHCNTDDKKNGVTIKGDSAEYLRARDIIFKLFNKKGRKMVINNRKLQILDNIENKPIRVEVKPPKGPSGKVNVKIYQANKSGIATFMITKTKDSELVHVKTLAFRVIRYLLDGIIDGVLKEADLNSFKSEENEDLARKGLICQQCGEDFKTENGMNIHMQNVHGILKEIDCDLCEKVFSTENDRRTHLEKEHELQHEILKDYKCDKCKFTFQNSVILGEHAVKCGVNEKTTENETFQLKCDYCDLKLSTENVLNAKQVLSKHHETCTFVPKQHLVNKDFNCKDCGFTTKKEKIFKRHCRDKHDAVTVSTSPKPKKRKQIELVELMDVDPPAKEKEIDEHAMEIDDNRDILIERSKMWDEKIMKKNQRVEEEENKILKEKEEKSKRDQLEKQNQKKALEKQKRIKSKVKNKLLKKKTVIHPYLRELPIGVKNLLGDNYLLYPVAGDGACALRSIAGWIFQDPSLGPYLGRNVNEHFVKNWHYWQSFFTFPHKRSIGNGKEKVFHDSKELFEFLSKAEDGAFMWRDHEDLAAISNIYKVKIKVVTVVNTMDQNPIVSIQEPDPNFDIIDEAFPPGQIPEIVLYHVKDLHYDLIVPKDSKIAIEGGLDLQRKIQAEYSNEKTKVNDSLKESEKMQRKITELESLVKDMTEKIKILEAEKSERGFENKYTCSVCDESYKSKEYVKSHIENEQKEREVECDQCKLRYSSMKLLEEHARTHIEYEDFNCEKCDLKHNSKASLEDHVSKHSQNECQYCKEIFFSESQLEMHIKESHTKNCKKCGEIFPTYEQLEEHNLVQHKSETFCCRNCNSEYKTKMEYEEHIKIHKDCEYSCEDCGKKFRSKVQLDNHILDEHKEGTVKRVKQFNCKDCSFQGDNWTMLKKHIQIMKHNPVEYNAQCYTCKNEFHSYWALMTHRKKEHPSNKICRYYLKQQCSFEDEICWYRHEDLSKVDERGFDCRECENKFLNRRDLMFHKKEKHVKNVEKCRAFKQGTCKENSVTCWFIHEEKVDINDDMEIEELPQNSSVFQDVRDKAPPDQLNLIIEMMQKLEARMKCLEKNM